MLFKHDISKDEWYLLEEINLLIYDIPAEQILPLLLKKVKSLISYSHSLSYLIQYDNGMPTSFQYESPDIPQPHLRLYVEKFIMIDFINWYVRSSDKTVFRESDIVPDSIRLNSSFMSKWMMPMGLYHGAGMIISRNGIRYAGMFFYRDENEPNFSDHDIEILHIINERLCRKFSATFPNGIINSEMEKLPDNIIDFDDRLTNREKEIISYIDAGVLRNDLCNQLHITENTLNKHFANIYRKLNISSFEQLMRMLKGK